MKKAWLLALSLIAVPVYSATLKDVLIEAREHENSRNLRLSIKASQYDYQAALLNWTPRLSLDREWSERSRESLTRNFGDDSSLTFNARLNLFRGLGDIARTRSSRHELEASENLADSEWLTLELSVAELYFRCVSEKELVRIIEDALAIRKDLENVARQRFNRGSLSKDEYIKLEIDRHLAENDLSTQRYRLEACVRDLKYWARNLEGPVQTTELLETIRGSLLKPSLMDEHPDWLSLENRTESDRWSIWAQGGDLFPQVDLSYNYRPGTSYQDREHALALTLSWDIFGGGADLMEYQKAKVNYRIGQNRLSEFQKDWERKRDNAMAFVRERLEIYERNVRNSRLADEIYQAGLRRFQSGSISSSEVALDQSRLIDAKRARWDAWYELHQSWLALLAVRGEGVQQYL